MRHILLSTFGALLMGCSALFPQPPSGEVNPFLLPDTLSFDPARAMMLFQLSQQLERKEIDFTAKSGVPFYFHSTKFAIDTNRILWVNDIPHVRLSPLRRIDCGNGVWYYENMGPEPGRDFSIDFLDSGFKSRFRMRLEAIMLDSLFLKLSWIQIE
jgi:hypothetical protein